MVTAFGLICAGNPHVSKFSSLSERLIFQFKITRTKQQANWSPCDNNGGTCVEIAGADYCVFAADTRISTGYRSSYSRLLQNYSAADVRALQKVLAARHMIYQHQHNKQMSCPAMAQLLSNTLYFKRFFPYYSYSVLGGLDSEGTGCVFTYDAVGSYERMGYSAQGSGATPLHTSWTAN